MSIPDTSDLRVIDTANVVDLMSRFEELRVPLAPPAGVPEQTAADLAAVYARQAAELARLVEDADRAHRSSMRVLLQSLSEMHEALDELAGLVDRPDAPAGRPAAEPPGVLPDPQGWDRAQRLWEAADAVPGLPEPVVEALAQMGNLLAIYEGYGEES
jgi:hypothetical protein